MGSEPATRVRFATSADKDVVSRYNYMANIGGPDVVRRMLDQRHVVIAERGERAAGYAYFDFLGVLNPFLAMIWVFDEYRGIGISRDILVFLEDHFRRGGHEVLYSSSRADGAVPQAWHRHMGFEECGFIIGLGEGDVGEVYFRKRLR